MQANNTRKPFFVSISPGQALDRCANMRQVFMESSCGCSLTFMRLWRDIALELVQQTDKQRIVDLTQELNRALEEQSIDAIVFVKLPIKLPIKPN